MTATQPASRQSSKPDRRTRDKPWPGAWPGAAVMLLSGLTGWFWLLPQLATNDRPPAGAAAAELAEVDEADMPGALSTMDLPGSALERLRDASRRCEMRLAWVTLARAPGGASPSVRLRSGGYFSPVVAVPETPVRVAIPYPAPYRTGHGSVAVLGVGAGLTVALTPAWIVPANAAAATRDVTWHPAKDCPPP